MDAQNDLSAWISSIPKVTKYWFFSFFLLPLTTRLGLISPFSLLLYSEAVIYKFQVMPPSTPQSHLYASLSFFPSPLRFGGC